ncbi:hypothetical protein BDP27DRAFT_315435 [Rhodocollybia butyracea]|uniref:Uncharacterized protein n=1 Tax=Rhodocollybia butyracea TaxID=206335 RepID=A0A9P5Q185_9AGAR|nr:hypothetical protein BDP27DRAFT_315435 [Rhodocollybia butyracea]
MCRVLLLWSLMLLQTSEILPWPLAAQTDPVNLSLSSIVYRLGRWSASWETEDVCWHTFGAICVAFCVEGLVKGLDGNGHGFGFGFAEANTTPFNLVGYAFLLHIYSSPLTHAYKPYKADFNSEYSNSELLPSRPDSHILVTLTVPLLQLTLFHLLSVRKRWSRHRLVPTALASILSLTHFHITLIRYMIGASSSTLSSNSVTNITNATTTSIPYTYIPHHTTHGYPILNYIPNIFETMLLSTIILTIFLNTITQLLLTGSVNKPLLGLGINTNTSEGWMAMIPWDEDFSIVLLRIGTASFEASGKVGWGNEVGGVVASSPSDSDSSSAAARRYGSIRLTRSGVADVSPGHAEHTSQKGSTRIKNKILKGWHNEVRDVDLGSSATSTRRLWGINGIFTLNSQCFVELKKFVRTAWSVVLVAIRMGWEVVRGRRKLFQRHRRSPRQIVSRSPFGRRITG